jgi:hypothetical protein
MSRRAVAIAVLNGPEILRHQHLAVSQVTHAAVSERKVGAAGIFRCGRMTALFHFGEVVSDALQKIHVEMPGGSFLFTEDNCLARQLDGLLVQGFARNRRHAEAAAHLRLEAIVPAIDEKTARRLVGIGHGRRRNGGLVGRANENAEVFVAVAQRLRPARMARIAIIAMTTSSSISVNPPRARADAM